MRWFIVRVDEDPGPFIMAEVVDEEWAKDVNVLSSYTVLAEDELRLDPDLSGALAAWEAKDDRMHAGFLAAEVADSLVDIAWIEAIREGAAPRPDPVDIPSWGELAFPPEVQQYYEASAPVWDRIHEAQRDVGDQAAAQTARMIARDLVHFAEKHGPRVI